MQAPSASISGIGTAFDHPGFLQSINHSGQGDRLDFHQVGNMSLSDAGMAGEGGQHAPLLTGNAN
jgi:hypothetical protein